MTSAETSSTSAKREPRGWLSSRTWFWGMLVAAVTWLSALAVLAVLTANPVTLNRAQLLDSDAIVVARVTTVSASGAGEVSVERVLRGTDVADSVRVIHLPDMVRAGKSYVLPLRRQGRRFAVTPAPAHAEKTWLVYPATEEVTRVAEELLANQPMRPYL